jgi:hypothetical protein
MTVGKIDTRKVVRCEVGASLAAVTSPESRFACCSMNQSIDRLNNPIHSNLQLLELILCCDARDPAAWRVCSAGHVGVAMG